MDQPEPMEQVSVKFNIIVLFVLQYITDVGKNPFENDI